MSLSLTEEQRALRDVTRRMLMDVCTPEHVRAVMSEDGLSRDVWSRLAEMGLLGLMVPEAHGGAGLGYREAAIVAEELGRVVAPVPYIVSSIIAATAILESGDATAATTHLPGIASGDTIVTVAVEEPRAPTAGSLTTIAKPQGDTWSVTGTKVGVPHGGHADQILVIADTTDGATLFVVDGAATGVTVTPAPSLDQTLPVARLDLDAVPATLLGAVGDGTALLDRAVDAGAVVLASEQVGAATWCLDTAVEYAKTRKQFGTPIGAFQAIQFRCADMLIALEESRSAAIYGAWALDHAPEEIVRIAPLAKAWVSDAFLSISGDMIQVLGGIGYTWEHDAHLYFKRAAATKALFGDPDHHRARLAATIGLVGDD